MNDIRTYVGGLGLRIWQGRLPRSDYAGFVPIAQWCGVAMKKVPSASLRVTAERHSPASVGVNDERMRCLAIVILDTSSAPSTANCGKSRQHRCQ